MGEVERRLHAHDGLDGDGDVEGGRELRLRGERDAVGDASGIQEC